MSKPKTVDEAFTSGWNKTVSWAQSNNIDENAYVPVYQMDAQRLQSGDYPMSSAERHIAILAAQNPNNVPPTSSTMPGTIWPPSSPGSSPPIWSPACSTPPRTLWRLWPILPVRRGRT
jgi:hypothetical protein